MYSAGASSGGFTRIQRATGTAPPDGCKPCPRRNDRAALGVGFRGVRPTAEPGSRTARVDRRRGSEVLPEVEQDVDERVADLLRRRQRAGVIAAAPHLPVTAKTSIHRTRCPSRQTLQATNQRLARGRFGDQMQVIGLHGEVNETKALVAGGCKRRTQCAKSGSAAQRWQLAPRANRHVDGVPRLVRGPRVMSLVRALRHRSPTGPWTSPSPGRR